MEASLHSLPTATGSSPEPESVESTSGLRPEALPATLLHATPLKHVGRKGPVPKRRYQEGTFRIEHEHYYSFFYRDRITADGTRSVKERFDHGKVGELSELAARKLHDKLRQQINRERGAVVTAPKGKIFEDAAKAYVEDVAPHLSISTIRQRQSHLRCHLTPRFGKESLAAIDKSAVQRFATDLLRTNSRKTIVNILGTLFAVLEYANAANVSFSELTIAPDREEREPAYFKPVEAERIVQVSAEPYRTMFALLWATGLRAGELLGLCVADLDLERGIVTPRKQADDRTRELRELKTKKSKSPIPLTPDVSAMLSNYLRKHWKANLRGLMFPNRTGRPRKRANVVKFGLRPVLRKLGLQCDGYGLHAFRPRPRDSTQQLKSEPENRAANFATHRHQDHVPLLRPH